MQKKANLKTIKILSVFLFITLGISCSKNEIKIPNQQFISNLKLNCRANITGVLGLSDCFIAGMPALNLGDLDDRDSLNCYKEENLGNSIYGRYRINPAGNTEVDLSVRIERVFNHIKRSAGRRMTFQAIFRISEVDISHTYFAQVKGHDNGTTNRDPLVMLRAVPSIDPNKFDILREDVLWVGGKMSNGGRTLTKITSVDKNTDFTIKIIAGYSSDNTKSFSNIYVNGIKSEKSNGFETDLMMIRYGAYRAEQSNATIYVRNTTFSVSN